MKGSDSWEGAWQRMSDKAWDAATRWVMSDDYFTVEKARELFGQPLDPEIQAITARNFERYWD